MRIGIIREGKVPPDARVPLTPKQCAYIMDKYPVEIWIQPSESRCFLDEEYEAEGVILTERMEDCDVLMGVKEVPIGNLINDKTYFFFSHTIKKQVYNRKLLQALVAKNIRMIDYEALKKGGRRVIAFGRWAGIVGAHNAMWTYGQRTKKLELPRMAAFKNFDEVKVFYDEKLELPNIKIVLTGTGRVGQGSAEVLDAMGIRKVKPYDFLTENFEEPVYTQLFCKNYAGRIDESEFNKDEFYTNPELYKSIFEPYTQVADIMINGIYWDNAAPQFFTKEEMKKSDFKIKVIADVTCDIAPVASIPSTLYATTIEKPVFGYNSETEAAEEPYQLNTIDMMTVDNLPNELPRDASNHFGEQFINSVLEELMDKENSDVMRNARITRNGDLTPKFEYLRDYLNK
ncbi:MAG: alanine dehydrogenase [Saprospiraceae bacterium]|jgi:alanine dehydrogenase